MWFWGIRIVAFLALILAVCWLLEQLSPSRNPLPDWVMTASAAPVYFLSFVGLPVTYAGEGVTTVHPWAACFAWLAVTGAIIGIISFRSSNNEQM